MDDRYSDDDSIQQEQSIIIKELLEDFIENFSKHRTVVDELCITPFYSYLRDKFRIHTTVAYCAILVFLVVNILTLLIAWDLRSSIRRVR